jgi:hypothetical protein
MCGALDTVGVTLIRGDSLSKGFSALAKTVKFNFAVDSSRMIRALETPDDMGAVIRIHFEMDRALEHVVNATVPDASHLRHQYMESRIRFLLALGLPELRLTPAKIINEIRNKFAHREKETVTASDVTKLSDAVTTLIGKEIPSHFAIKDMRAGSFREWRYGEMTRKEQFCLLGYIALAGIATIENDFGKICFTQIGKTKFV